MKKKYDAILVVNNLNEDDRYHARRSPDSSPKGPGIYVGLEDPKMHANNNFGRALRDQLKGMTGSVVKVSDFGKYVSVDVGFHDYITGRTSTKTFLIVFEYKGDGLVFSSSTKWRTISGVDQAVSYIRSACSSLQSDVNRKL